MIEAGVYQFDALAAELDLHAIRVDDVGPHDIAL